MAQSAMRGKLATKQYFSLKISKVYFQSRLTCSAFSVSSYPMTIVEHSERWIADQAIRLVEKYGQPFKLEQMTGFSQSADVGDFSLMYTTPFSGLEVLPGRKMYMVDIWLNQKKVFSCAYETLEDLSYRRPRKSGWLENFHALH